jgi:hypothetical protein
VVQCSRPYLEYRCGLIAVIDIASQIFDVETVHQIMYDGHASLIDLI